MENLRKRRQAVLVVGCGVSGLSCGVRLLEAGYAVRVVGAAPPLETTSAVAAAIWYPYQSWPRERVLGWARASLAEFHRLRGEEPSCGITDVDGVEVFPAPVQSPSWGEAVPEFRPALSEELPQGRPFGFRFLVPVVEMPVYLPWLQRRYLDLGGELEIRRLESLEVALRQSDVVINCTGLGAREFARDPEVYATRGQLVRVERGGVDRYIIDEHGPDGIAYVVPRSRDVILGGTSVQGDENLQPDPEEARSILRRCTALEPRLASARKLSDAVGLRPGRERVRLEAERPAPGKLVVHDYGHGGAGVTLSWGCADEVLHLVDGANEAAPS
jgi:D-amino-acid oxidase